MPFQRLEALPAVYRGMLWTIATGILFTLLNAVLRHVSFQLHPFETQFLRYVAALAFMLPWVVHGGLAAFRPNRFGGQFWRGGVHTAGLMLWFSALPHVPLADGTAIAYTLPVFVMIGAAIFLGERMRAERWIAAIIAFVGVMIVLAPKAAGTGGVWNFVILAAQPLFAASMLITKQLTRYDRPEVIVVWQALVIGLLTLPFALWFWTWPTATQWGWIVVSGALGSAGQYCNARAIRATDVSATQSVRFLELIWATIIGYIVFSDRPSESTLIGGLVIVAATMWVARREARPRA